MTRTVDFGRALSVDEVLEKTEPDVIAGRQRPRRPRLAVHEHAIRAAQILHRQSPPVVDRQPRVDPRKARLVDHDISGQ